jgi:hypothetical protein
MELTQKDKRGARRICAGIYPEEKENSSISSKGHHYTAFVYVQAHMPVIITLLVLDVKEYTPVIITWQFVDVKEHT